MMDYSIPDFDIHVDPAGFILDVGSLFDQLARLTDSRRARGQRDALVTILVFVVLAQLAGQDRLKGISPWIRYREESLAEVFHLKKPRAPCATTYKNILERAIDLEAFERVVREFFAAQPNAGQSIVISLEGQTLRGTISAGHTRGHHLLAAYLPQEGWVLFQVEVDRHENEMVAAPTVLKGLDLRGKIVVGDAMFAQRTLSHQMVQAGGHDIWTVKDNQLGLQQDIEFLFQPEQTTKGFSPGTKDFRTAATTEKNHGRLEHRRLTVSAELKGYLAWPGAEQVFKLERHFTRLVDGQVAHQEVYGITSLKAGDASPQPLVLAEKSIRAHFALEQEVHRMT